MPRLAGRMTEAIVLFCCGGRRAIVVVGRFGVVRVTPPAVRLGEVSHLSMGADHGAMEDAERRVVRRSSEQPSPIMFGRFGARPSEPSEPVPAEIEWLVRAARVIEDKETGAGNARA